MPILIFNSLAGEMIVVPFPRRPELNSSRRASPSRARSAPSRPRGGLRRRNGRTDRGGNAVRYQPWSLDQVDHRENGMTFLTPEGEQGGRDNVEGDAQRICRGDAELDGKGHPQHRG